MDLLTIRRLSIISPSSQLFTSNVCPSKAMNTDNRFEFDSEPAIDITIYSRRQHSEERLSITIVSLAIKEAIARADIDREDVELVVIGNAIRTKDSMLASKQATILAELSTNVNMTAPQA